MDTLFKRLALVHGSWISCLQPSESGVTGLMGSALRGLVCVNKTCSMKDWIIALYIIYDLWLIN